MRQAIEAFLKSNRQTKFFIFMGALYMIALAWTTIQAYARLAYSRSDLVPPIVIHIPSPPDQQ